MDPSAARSRVPMLEIGESSVRLEPAPRAEILERNVRREINRTVNSRQRQHVKSRESQRAAGWAGRDSVRTYQGKLCYAAVACVDDWIAVERQTLELKGGDRKMRRVGKEIIDAQGSIE